MADTSALDTLDNLVDGYMWKSKIDESEWMLLYNLAIDGYRELNLRILDTGRLIKKLTMNKNYVVYFPQDLQTINCIGVPLNGKLWPLTRDSGMITTTTEEDGGLTLDEDWGEEKDVDRRFVPNYAMGGGINTEGYYEIDWRKRLIRFQNVDRTEIILDYNASGVSYDGVTYYPVMAKGALEKYIYKEYIDSRLDVPDPKKREAKRRYHEELDLLSGLTSPSLQEFRDELFKSLSQGPKRG